MILIYYLESKLKCVKLLHEFDFTWLQKLNSADRLYMWYFNKCTFHHVVLFACCLMR